MHAARGKDWETIAEEIIDDNVYAIERANKAAAKINATNPLAPVTWRDLIPLAMPAGTTMAMQDPNAVAVQEANVGADGEAVDGETMPTESTRNVAAEALNGAQVASLVEIINQIAAGVLPKETAKALIAAAFPLISSQIIDSIVDPVRPGSVVADGVQPVDANAKAAEASVGTSEFAGITRQQWNRNRKAIKDVLDEMIAGTTSEAAARVFLGGIGLSQASVDALIADANDGTVETPEVIEGA
jgi:hypothetical protein